LAASESPWWHDAVVYQVYPRSFADADGDGIGDLAGLRSRLDYLADLGVNAIWLTPFYPSPWHDGGYDVADYCDVDPRLGSLAGFDAMLSDARDRGIRVIVDMVPNHCSCEDPLFQAALKAGPGSPERDLFLFRPGRGPDGDEPPNNWPSTFGGPAWDRVADGDWYLHLFDSSQPDFNWHHPDVVELFRQVLRFWLDRGVAGLRIDVAHGLFKDPALPDIPAPVLNHAPSPFYHRPENQALFRSWRAILDSYPTAGFPGARTAIGEVWYDKKATLQPYLAPGGLPQVFNFDLITAPWDATAIRTAIDATEAISNGSQAPWVLGNHDVVRPVTRFGVREARAAALLQLALPGSAYIYQGEELGLPEVLDIPDEARQDPTFRRTGGARRGRDGCRVPLPWSPDGRSYGFSRTGSANSPGPWLPQPAGWGAYSAEAQAQDPGSYLSMYRAALRIRGSHPALGTGTPGAGDGDGSALRWVDDAVDGPAPAGVLHFRRDPGFEFFANLGSVPLPVPPHREVLLASDPAFPSHPVSVPPGTAVWLSVTT
jgi:alpha-glucosidase